MTRRDFNDEHFETGHWTFFISVPPTFNREICFLLKISGTNWKNGWKMMLWTLISQKFVKKNLLIGTFSIVFFKVVSFTLSIFQSSTSISHKSNLKTTSNDFACVFGYLSMLNLSTFIRPSSEICAIPTETFMLFYLSRVFSTSKMKPI